jgi:hypothetical protein
MNDLLKPYLVQKKPHALCVQAIQTETNGILPHYTMPENSNKSVLDYCNYSIKNTLNSKYCLLPDIQRRRYHQRIGSQSVLKMRNEKPKVVNHKTLNKRSNSNQRMTNLDAVTPSAFNIQKRNNSVFLKSIDTETIIEFSPHNSNHISFTKIANRCVSTNKLNPSKYDISGNSQKLEQFLSKIFPKRNCGVFSNIVKHKHYYKPL